MTPNQIRIENNKAIRKYERYGTKLFLEVLRKQSENFDPELMQNAYIEFYQAVFTDSATRQFRIIRAQEARTKAEVVDSFFLSTWRVWIKEWVLQNLLEIIAGVNENTANQIREITAQGIADGLNPTDLAKLIFDKVGSRSRALAIARTEGTTANSLGSKRSAEDWQIQTGETLYKIWIHSGNPRDPRPSHILAQNKPIPKASNFVIDGVPMEYPGDKKAPASQLINCLCSTVYLSERLARKRYPEAFE